MIDRIHIIHVPGVNAQRDEIVARMREEADACVHEDPDRNGCMWNWLNAAECAAKDTGPWSVILSDDAMPAHPDWKRHLTEAVMYSPSPILGLTYFGSFTESAVKKGVPYIEGPHTIWGGGVAYQRRVLKPLAEWARIIYTLTGYQHDDRLVSAFALKSGYNTAVVTRAIFDQPVEESLLGHAGGSRQAQGHNGYAGRSCAHQLGPQPSVRGEAQRVRSRPARVAGDVRHS